MDGPVNILIVDDKINNIYALEQMLSKPDRNFISATSGQEALKIVLNKDISLIILDVQMPEMDGFEVAQILKSNKRTKDIPIIFASAEKIEHQFIMKGFEEGAIDYLPKPLDKEITEAKVTVLLKLYLQQRELKEKNLTLEKYALLINNSADLISIINPENLEFTEVNNAAIKMLGYTTDEMKGTSLLNYLTEEYQQKVKKIKEENNENITFEAQFYNKNKEIKWLQWNVVNKYHLWFANARDITEHKKAEKEIKQLNKELEKNIAQLEVTNKELESFSYSVSHDLRAPLRAINGFANIIINTYKTQLDDEIKRLLGIIQKNTKKMSILIDELLAFSKLGRKELVKTTIHTNELVNKILKDLKESISQNVKIKINILHLIEGDYTLITQVFTNLISNAVKYSSKKAEPKLEIGSKEEGDEIIFYVNDNGAGFNMEYASKLFGVFQRLHTDEEFEGTGVGLAIVQRIIVKHGGRVWAEAEIDKGATFYFSLPKPENQLNERK